MTPICVGKVTIIGSDNGLSPWAAPSHYLNQCWIIVNWILRNKRRWNLNWNSNIFIHENALENVVCEMASILSGPQCVKNTCNCQRKTIRYRTYYIFVWHNGKEIHMMYSRKLHCNVKVSNNKISMAETLLFWITSYEPFFPGWTG